MRAPLGHCYWAVAPFAPAPPFRIYQEDAEARDVDSVEPFTEAVRKGMSEFVLLTPVKTRPVLVITGVLREHEEVLALRLRRLEKIATDAARDLVRQGEDHALFYLQPERFPGLPVENAAIVTSLLRLPVSAIDRRTSLGSLNEDDLRVVHERVARAHELKLDVMIVEQARRLLEAARGGAGKPARQRPR